MFMQLINDIQAVHELARSYYIWILREENVEEQLDKIIRKEFSAKFV